MRQLTKILLLSTSVLLYCQNLSQEENFAVAKNRKFFHFRGWASLIDFAGIKFRGWQKCDFYEIKLCLVVSRNSNWRLKVFYTLQKFVWVSPFFLFSRVENAFLRFRGWQKLEILRNFLPAKVSDNKVFTLRKLKHIIHTYLYTTLKI